SSLHVTSPPLSSPLIPYTPLFRSAVGTGKGKTITCLASTLPVYCLRRGEARLAGTSARIRRHDGRHRRMRALVPANRASPRRKRSEEHTSELQSRGHLVCRLLLEK